MKLRHAELETPANPRLPGKSAGVIGVVSSDLLGCVVKLNLYKMKRIVNLIEQERLIARMRGTGNHEKRDEIYDIRVSESFRTWTQLLNKSSQLITVGRENETHCPAKRIEIIRIKKSSILHHLQQSLILVREFFHGRKNLKQPNVES
jgi:hypothetical protein